MGCSGSYRPSHPGLYRPHQCHLLQMGFKLVCGVGSAVDVVNIHITAGSDLCVRVKADYQGAYLQCHDIHCVDSFHKACTLCSHQAICIPLEALSGCQMVQERGSGEYSTV